MAFSVIYRDSTYCRKYIPHVYSQYPFIDWFLRGNSKPLIIDKNEHHGQDIHEYTSFILDNDGQSGYILFDYDGDYTYIDVCCRVLIDINKKELYISDIIVNYECIFWEDELKYTGGFKAFKRLEERNQILNTVMRFFGPEWRYHLRFTKRHQKNLKKSLFKKIQRTAGSLPNDMQHFIVELALPWKNKEYKVMPNDIQRLNDIVNSNVGAVNDTGFGIERCVVWDDIVAVYNPII